MADWDVTTANTALEFDTVSGLFHSCEMIDSNHFINFWQGLDADGYVQVFTVNTTTLAITTANASLEFDTVSSVNNSCFQIDSNHFINFWEGESLDGYVQVFTVNTSTWAVTTAADRLEFDTQYGRYNSCHCIDSNHFINFWRGGVGYGQTQVFTVNTSTWAVTTAGNRFQFVEIGVNYNSCRQIDANHFINFFMGESSDGYAQVLTVNTSTWAITTSSSSLEFDTVFGNYNCCYPIDANHFINFWEGESFDGYVQVFTVNTSTWAVTTAADRLEFDTQYGRYNSCSPIDSNHFINFFLGGAGYAQVQVFTINTSTWAVTTAAERLEFDSAAPENQSCHQIDSSHFIAFRKGADNDGFAQVFTVALAAAAPTGNAWYSFAQM